jgi:hypothetical protein
MTNIMDNEDSGGPRFCSDCGRLLGPYNHSPRCISCNFRRKRIRENGLIPGWERSPEYEAALDEMMKGGGPHIDKVEKVEKAK